MEHPVTRIGLESKGIYRLSGTTSKVQKLKAALDKGESSLTKSTTHFH